MTQRRSRSSQFSIARVDVNTATSNFRGERRLQRRTRTPAATSPDHNTAERGIDREQALRPTLPSPGSDRERGRIREGVRRYGTVPHAGFGLAPAFAGGTLACVTGLANVRDAIPFP